MVEVYGKNGIDIYKYDKNKLESVELMKPYFMRGVVGYNWEELPFIYFKSNEDELLLNFKG